MRAILKKLVPWKQRSGLDIHPAARRSCRVMGAAVLCLVLTGCTSITAPISGVPAHRLPPQFLAPPKNDLLPIDISRLRQTPPDEYLVDRGDILGIYVEGVLGAADEPPPVHFPDADSPLPPALGYPIPVRDDGTLSLPLVEPIQVRGLTLGQIEQLIRNEYTVRRQILAPGADRIIVTVMKERRYRVIVIRQDGVRQSHAGGRGRGSFTVGELEAARGETIGLPAYQNDVLHALAKTGGLPGVDAKNEIKILRSTEMDRRRRDEFVQKFYSHPCSDPCLCFPPLPEDPAVLRIPLRLPPGDVPRFTEQDIILEEGDIVLVEGREREVFYTGGLLPGGEWPLPRDYDLDVLGAMAIVGQGIAGQGMGRRGGVGGAGAMGGHGLIGGLGGVPPGQLFILRKTPCDGQITISVDLARAMEDPAARPLVQPGDMLILRFKPSEEVINFGLGTFFTFGIRELFRR